MSEFTALAAFLTACLDNDEERARFVAGELRPSWEAPEAWRLSWQDEYDLLCIEPSRALREIAAKRAIVKSLTDRPESNGTEILRLLASAYADHPDYSPERAV